MNTELTNSPALVPQAPPRSRRFAAMMYEGVLLFGPVFVADYAFDSLTQSRSGLTLLSVRQIFLFIIIGLYFTICWKRSGQTLPMKAWNIRLVSDTGGPLSTAKMLLRYGLMWVLPLITFLMIKGLFYLTGWPGTLILFVLAPFTNLIPTWFTQGQQFLHDRFAGNALIEVNR